ncbi:hypothetical protein SLS53_006847 [Cytospora paraplurivora]|uniref:Uncharacterized protein n=1 Tax=Cytospora paraplurivora TaxID=2898453 RepID=A0AAN9U1U0_9PEZI
MPTAVQFEIHEKDLEALSTAWLCGEFLADDASKVEDPAIQQQWSTFAKDNKDSLRDLLERVKIAFDETDMAEDHNPGSLLKEESEHEDEAPQTASLSDDVLPRPRKRARLELEIAARRAKQEVECNEQAGFFRALAEGQYAHSFDFSEKCTAIKAIAKQRPVPVMGRVMAGRYHLVDLTLLYDSNGTAVFLPSSIVPYMMDFIAFVRSRDKDKLTDTMPALFILKSFLHITKDFGPVTLQNREGEAVDDNRVADIDATLQAWKNKYQSGLRDFAEDLLATRIVAMRNYVAAHGVAKAVTLTHTELEDKAETVTNAQLDVAYGRNRKFSAFTG